MFEKGRWSTERAKTVVDEVHLDPFGGLSRKQVRKPHAGFISRKNEGLQIDIVFGILNRLGHGGVGSWSIDEQCRFVSDYQRVAADRLFYGKVPLQNVRGKSLPLEPLQD